jgi:hypothetical protein
MTLDTFLIPQKPKYNFCPSPLHSRLKSKAFSSQLNQTLSPSDVVALFSDTGFTEYQPCLPDIPAPTIPVPHQVRNRLQHPNHALPPVLRRRESSSIAANAEMALSC